MTNRMLGAALRRIRFRPAPDPFGADAYLETMGTRNRQIIERARPYTMTGVARLLALIEAIRYCVRRDVPGDFAECGVWRGGSVLAMILALQDIGVTDRDIHLFDTYEGMTVPTERDRSRYSPPAIDLWNEYERRGARLGSDPESNLESVREVVLSTGYPADRLHFVKGPVEETLPEHSPERIAILRLDTDWYESTRHELTHLFPRLSDGGVLLVDDYGHWEGCRRAVDEYFGSRADGPLLTPLDYTGRLAVRC